MNISFAMTTPQYRARTKCVTRRLGWKYLKRGTILQAIEKGQGLKKGEHVTVLGRIRVVDVRREPLRRMLTQPDYGQAECRREGFPGLTPAGFVQMFCKANDCKPGVTVTRILFEYVEG